MEAERLSSEYILETRDLWHVYDGAVQAVRGVSLQIRPGEFVAFVGSNGSGKTTLIKHFNGLHRPTRGSMWVNGRDARRATVSRLSRVVGFVFQNPDHQIFCYSVWDEILFGLRQQKLPAAEAEARASRALELVGLSDRRERHPRELSRGQRQRLATASVLAMETPVLVLDEPTTGQDFLARRQIMGLAAELHQRGRTIVMVTHDMALVAEYASRVVVMQAGQVLLDAPPQTVFERPEVLAVTGLRLPPVLELANALRAGGWAVNGLTLDELAQAVAEAVSQRHAARPAEIR
jgi:energy-coupling factor transport system ATP-binding protein